MQYGPEWLASPTPSNCHVRIYQGNRETRSLLVRSPKYLSFAYLGHAIQQITILFIVTGYKCDVIESNHIKPFIWIITLGPILVNLAQTLSRILSTRRYERDRRGHRGAGT